MILGCLSTPQLLPVRSSPSSQARISQDDPGMPQHPLAREIGWKGRGKGEEASCLLLLQHYLCDLHWVYPDSEQGFEHNTKREDTVVS